MDNQKIVIEELVHKEMTNIQEEYNYYINYEVVPKGECRLVPDDSCKKQKIGIVLQGPIQDAEFLKNTILLYKRAYPGIYICVSTWEGENTSCIDELVDDNTYVLKNAPNIYKAGISHLNLQIKSTMNGINCLRKKGVEYIAKSRVDQRFIRERVFSYLIAIVNYFRTGQDVNNQHDRIIFLDRYTQKYVPFHASDMFQFGYIEDMYEYWNVPYSNMSISNLKMNIIMKGLTIEEEVEYDFPEIYLMTTYAKKKLGKQYQYSIDLYYQFLKQRCIVVDGTTLGLVWIKKFNNERFLYTDDAKEQLSQVLTFKDWFQVYVGDFEILDIYREKQIGKKRRYG